MREIKFRAWDKVNKNMLYDVSTGTVTIWYKEISAKSENCVFMQYTGLKDKNGKEIYEGDIVKVKQIVLMQDMYKVVWNEKIACFEYEDGPYMDDYGNVQPGILYPDECIVIGNIYENPELLGEKSAATL